MTSRRVIQRANRKGRPYRIAVRAVELSVLALPAGDLRNRYERELIAELYGLNARRQAGYALTTVLCAWSLRSAVTGTSRGGTMTIVKPRKPLLCRLNLKHHYVRETTEDGTRYLTCSRCGKDYDAGVQSNWGAGLG